MTNPAATKLDDAFGAARSYLRAIRLMSETIFQGSGDDYCALLTMLDGAALQINLAQEATDELAEALPKRSASHRQVETA